MQAGGGRGTRVARDADQQGQGGAQRERLDVTPAEATGSFALSTRPLETPAVDVPFEAPMALEINPDQPARNKAQGAPQNAPAKTSSPPGAANTRTPPDPILTTYRAVFAEAVAAAARLHASLREDMGRAAQASRRRAEIRAERRQENLDRDLTNLDEGLEEARAALASGAADARFALSDHAANARAAIHAAAGRANGAIGGTHARVSSAKRKEQTSANQVAERGAGKTRLVHQAGEGAERALGALNANPEARFPAGGASMVSAQNERIALRIPPRAVEQRGVMHEATAAQDLAVVPMIAQLGAALGQAFQTFDQWLGMLEHQAPAAVNRGMRSSLDQVEHLVKTVGDAIETGRRSADAILVRQKNEARARLIANAEAETHSEQVQADARAQADVRAAAGLARTPASSVRGIVETLRGERHRPEEDFARVVTSVARALMPRLKSTAELARERQRHASEQALAGLDRQSAGAADQMAASVTNASAGLAGVASSTSAGLRAQADGSAQGMRSLAVPVARTTAAFLPSINQHFNAALDTLRDDIGNAGTNLDHALNGEPPSPAPIGPPRQPVPTPGPHEAPNVFKARAEGIAAAPELETELDHWVAEARAAVELDIRARSSGLQGEFRSFIHSEENIFSNLRGMLPRQAAGLRGYYDPRHGRSLIDALTFYFDTTLSFSASENEAAALAYARGDAAAGALNEMRAAVVLWNETARIERVQRSLTPAQVARMKTLDGADAALADIRGDIDGVDRQVFDALMRSDAQGVAEANALRLTEAVDKARERRGYQGGDRTYVAIRDAARAAGSDVLSGADELRGKTTDLRTSREQEAVRAQTWQQTQEAFAAQHPLARERADPRDPGAALVKYASAERVYYETHGHGEGTQSEIIHESLDPAQRRLIDNLVRTGEDSAATRAALLAVQHQRGDRGVDDLRIDDATHFSALDEPIRPNDPDQARRRAEALRQRDETFRLFDQYTRGVEAVRDHPRDAAAVRDQLAHDMSARVDDSARAAYLDSMIRDEHVNPVTAINYAVSGWSTKTDVLRRTFSRMTRDQVDQAAADYARTHNGQSLYARLGIYGEGDWWHSALSGEERQEIAVLAMGRAENDQQRAEIAAMEARLQINEAGWLGKHLASDEYGTLRADYQRLLNTMGVSEAQFDPRGRLLSVRTAHGDPVVIGNFDEHGAFRPPQGMHPEDLEIAMGQSGISARAYTAATDRIASAITTALVVVAAVVTTALTGGAAASIWIPVLVTAGAGLAGIAASAAIKGGRYGRDEMLHDLAATVVQAVTAGIGAAAGVALRGGMPALRAVAGSMKVAETAIEGSSKVLIGGVAARGSLSLMEEAFVAGGSNALGSMGQAALDREAWRNGGWGEGISHAGGIGFLGGALGSTLMRPVMRVGMREGVEEGLGRHVLRRGLGSAVSGTTTRGVELAAGDRDGRRMEFSEAMNELGGSFLQNFIQGAGEGGAERGAKHLAEARQARASGAGLAHPPPSERTLPSRAPLDPPRVEEPEARAPAARAPSVAREAEPPPVPPMVRDIAPEIAQAVERGPLRETTETMRAETPPEAQAPVPRTGRGGGREVEDEAAPRRAAPAEPAGGRRAAAPEIIELEHLPEMTVMMDADPRSRPAAEENYSRLVHDDPHREVAVYYNPITGEHIVVQGVTDAVFVAAGARGGAEEGPLGAGRKQAWKELLDHDLGHWELLAHYHPPSPETGRTPLWRRLPSGADADFGIMREDARKAGSGPHQSRIHYTDNGRPGYTDFGFDPHSTSARYWVEVDNPISGTRERHEFRSIREYESFYEEIVGPAHPAPDARGEGGVPTIGRRDTPTPAPPGKQAAPAAPALPDELVLYHGTTREGRATIEAEGISLKGREHDNQDFGRGFYLTEDPATGAHYARERHRTVDNEAKIPAEQRRPGEVLEFRIPREALGEIVDVRPGGEHRQLWEDYLKRPPSETVLRAEFGGKAMPPMLAEMVDRQFPTTEDYIALTEGRRGIGFQDFLERHNLAHADVIVGDLGGRLTSGIAIEGGGGQFAVRTPKAIAALNAIMRAQMGQDPGTGGPSAPRMGKRGARGGASGVPEDIAAGASRPEASTIVGEPARMAEPPGEGGVRPVATAAPEGAAQPPRRPAEPEIASERPAAAPQRSVQERSVQERPAEDRTVTETAGTSVTTGAPEREPLPKGVPTVEIEATESTEPPPTAGFANHADPVAGFNAATHLALELDKKLALLNAADRSRKDHLHELRTNLEEALSVPASRRHPWLKDLKLENPSDIARLRSFVDDPARRVTAEGKTSNIKQAFDNYVERLEAIDRMESDVRAKEAALERQRAGVRADLETLRSRLATEVRPYNGVHMTPQVGEPVAGWAYEPAKLEGGTAANQLSHLHGFQAELRLTNDIALNRGELVVSWGIRSGVHGADVLSVHPVTGEVTLWDSKYLGDGGVHEGSSTFEGANLQKAIARALADLGNNARSGHLPASVRRQAEENLIRGNFCTATISSTEPTATDPYPIKGEVWQTFRDNSPVK